MPKIKTLSFARFQAVLGALIGLLLGVFYSVGGFIIDALVSLNIIASAQTPGLSEGTLLAFLALIGMPLIGAVVGFMLGLVGAFLYNLFAKWIGRIDLNFSK